MLQDIVKAASIIKFGIVYILFTQLKSNCIIITLLLEDKTTCALKETLKCEPRTYHPFIKMKEST